MATGFLMYHELERQGRPLADTRAGYMRYVLEEARFASELAWLACQRLRGVSVGRACAAGLDAPGQVVLTFDDGCESDWVVAAPHLLQHGCGATFYVVSGWVGKRAGFLSPAQLRELAAAGFEIGSHTATHAFLSDLGNADLRGELQDSKRELEDMLGHAVAHVSCPGGRWNRRVADAAREAGYETMATSRIGANGRGADPFALARCAMQRDTPEAGFEAFCRGRGLAALQFRSRMLTAAKTVLGNRLYTSVRDSVLAKL